MSHLACATDVRWAGRAQAGQTSYWGNNPDQLNTDELRAQYVSPPRQSYVDELVVRIGVNDVAASTTYTLRINAIDTTLTLSVGAGVTGTFVVANLTELAANDLISFEGDATAAGGNKSARGTAWTEFHQMP